MLSDTFYGFRFIAEKRGLLGLQLNFSATNLLLGVGFTLLTPMLMLRTGNDTVITGTVQSAFGIGGVVGGIALSAWGGPKRKVDGVFLGMAASALLGMTMMGVAQTPLLLMVGAFLTMLFIPTSNGSNQAIWQAKVPPEVQGRVFATRALIATMSTPIGMAVAGPLADKVMTPAMEPGGALSGVFGWLVGTGPGAGIGLLYVLLGLLGAAITLSGYAFKSVRDVEKDIPDHDAAKK
jgi:MFS family permease